MKDISIVSAKWLNITESEVYTPPPNFPTLQLAMEHTTPIPSWRKCDIMKVLFTNSMRKLFQMINFVPQHLN